MQFFGNIKNAINKYAGPISGNDDLDFAVESNSTEDILREESRILKEKFNVLLRENELMKQSTFNSDKYSSNSSQLGNFFKDFKTTFFSSEKSDESMLDYKNFLLENKLLFENFDDEDSEFLSNVSITEDNWQKSKDFYIFKQKLLERNYRELFKNMQVANELNSSYKFSNNKNEFSIGNAESKTINNMNYDNNKSKNINQFESKPKTIQKESKNILESILLDEGEQDTKNNFNKTPKEEHQFFSNTVNDSFKPYTSVNSTTNNNFTNKANKSYNNDNNKSSTFDIKTDKEQENDFSFLINQQNKSLAKSITLKNSEVKEEKNNLDWLLEPNNANITETNKSTNLNIESPVKVKSDNTSNSNSNLNKQISFDNASNPKKEKNILDSKIIP